MQDAVLSMPNESLLESARSAYVLERIYRIMKRSIWALTEQIRHGTFQPAGYEVDFMQVNELNVQNMILDEEHKMRLVGKIDRMDTRETEEAVYVRIIDYKSGKTTFQLLNLYYGQQLQLVVYLNAAMAQLKRSIREKKSFRPEFFTIGWMIRWWKRTVRMRKKSWSISWVNCA